MIVQIEDVMDLKNKLEAAGNTLVVIDFFATWCGPCKMISPKLEKLAEEMQDVIFLKVDIDECVELATEYDIISMPSFVFIKNGQVLESFSGANYNRLKSTILKHK
ncbi:PREDICTED: thioredoxin-2-like [Eufriesea mexicana]|uniref:thioredoxin-2-like n=1 Tax=Eufriesea mexicana TaxID=516756 RepID=UPI00083C1E5D|nr:PREDICTED: thioredoxin-2-like [Eufriesea mexicana]